MEIQRNFQTETRIISCDKRRLKLKDNPFICKTYPIPLNHEQTIKEEIRQMLVWKIISRTVSPYVNPIVVAKKGTREFDYVSTQGD